MSVREDFAGAAAGYEGVKSMSDESIVTPGAMWDLLIVVKSGGYDSVTKKSQEMSFSARNPLSECLVKDGL